MHAADGAVDAADRRRGVVDMAFLLLDAHGHLADGFGNVVHVLERLLGREVAVCDFLRAREEVLDGPLDAALEDDVDRACQQQDDDERGNDIRRWPPH